MACPLLLAIQTMSAKETLSDIRGKWLCMTFHVRVNNYGLKGLLN